MLYRYGGLVAFGLAAVSYSVMAHAVPHDEAATQNVAERAAPSLIQ